MGIWRAISVEVGGKKVRWWARDALGGGYRPGDGLGGLMRHML